MGYVLGRYRNHEGREFDLNGFTYEEAKTFLWLRKEYENATSWKDFQERTAKRVVEVVSEAADRWKKKGYHVSWESHCLYQVRFDMLRNVGIRTGELKGELSDMIIKEEKE